MFVLSCFAITGELMSSIETRPVSIDTEPLHSVADLGIGAGSAGQPLPNALQSWLAITAIVLIAVDLRPAIVSIGPVLPSIRQEFHLSHAAASLLTSIPNLLMGSLALPTPWLARRFGRDRLLLVALILLCVSTAARAFSPNTPVLLWTTGGVGAGIAVAGTLIAGFIKANFPTKAALLMGIYAASLSVGSTITAATTGLLADYRDRGWRFATGTWSIFGLVAIITWTLVTIREHRHKMKIGRFPLHHHVSLHFGIKLHGSSLYTLHLPTSFSMPCWPG
jgi:CP family cyanate transporter-like MFS transporter